MRQTVIRVRARSKSSSPYRAQVVDRALDVLEALGGEEKAGHGLAELTAHLGLHKSTVHRLVMVLERRRYVERGGQNRRYRLGMKVFELGMCAAAKLDLVEDALPCLKRLSRASDETAHIGVLRDGEVISVANAEGPLALRTPATVGRRSPAHCTSLGKVLLAFLPEDELAQVITTRGLKAYTGETITCPALLQEELRRIRERGYAIDNEEFEEGLKCVGAAVRDYSGKVVAAISIAGAAFRMKSNRMPSLAATVIQAARELSGSLGHIEPRAQRKAGRA